MRWKGRRQSDNVEIRSGSTGRRVAAGGGLLGIVAAVIILLLGGDPSEVVQNLQIPQTAQQQSSRPMSAEEQELAEFVSVILADTEDVWREIFRSEGQQYRDAKLVIYSGATESACGFAQAAVGPFYCPGDETVYIDLAFLQAMTQKLGARGDFAWAYVVAHEIGHHVQNQLGILEKVHTQKQRLSQVDANRLEVRLELQADFLAGIWAHHAQRMKNILEEGDIEEGMNAASSVGDDNVMKRTQGYVVPDAFTHGTSEQRVRWFTLGFKTGDVNRGDTFAAREL
ncbi:MAG: neutral zinc metallopeptidase [Acidobacteriota bacterium]|jgi:predicted metalloprotease|nr:neutral zinc metallopeptidase [Acidobacteriota bacterium]